MTWHTKEPKHTMLDTHVAFVVPQVADRMKGMSGEHVVISCCRLAFLTAKW
jgi:hypothetical protein